MLAIFDTLPFRAIRGAFGGFEDGMRGRIDSNEQFIDGYRENDPSKKSQAGQFLSDYSGIRGGASVGERVGKWAGGLGALALGGSFMFSMVSGGLAAGAFVGLWPIIAGTLITGAAVFAGAAIGHYAGRYIGGFAGALTGAIGGTAVGLYNGIFRRGSHEKGKAPEAVEPPAMPIAPQPGISTPSQKERGVLGNASEGVPAQNVARAMQQADAGLASGQIRGDVQANPQQVAAMAAQQPQGFADRVRNKEACKPCAAQSAAR